MGASLQPGSLWSSSVNVQGLQVHARVSRPVPLARSDEAGKLPLLLVHGLVVASSYMVPIGKGLAADFDVFAPDFPGFGRSSKPSNVLTISEMADSLAAWLDVVGLGRVALLGNSIGCQIVVDFAVRYPERTGAIILVGPTMEPAARTAPRALLRWLRQGQSEFHLVRLWIRDLFRCGPRRAIRLFQYSLQDPIEEKLPRVQAPALVVRGSKDLIVPEQWAEEVARLLRMGHLSIIPGKRHPINFIAPLEVARVVRVFLTTHKFDKANQYRYESSRL